MLNEAERIERKTQIGASDIHKIFNFDNKGAIDLWKSKLGLIEDSDFSNQSMLVGNITEEDCLKFFMEKQGIKDYTLGERIEHLEIKNFVVSTDAIAEGVIPVENKSIKMDLFIGLKLNKNHYIQIQAQMSCLKAPYGVVLYNAIEPSDYVDPINYKPTKLKQEYFKVGRDENLIQEIEKRVSYFLWCLEFKYQPNEKHYLTRVLL